MTYTPDWEPLADALKRVIATGISEGEAKADLCRAMADRKIDVRARVAASDYGMRGKIFTDGNVGVPPHLKPVDLDWVHSRPLARWSIGPRLGEQYVWLDGWENRPLDLVELSSADVIGVLCGERRAGTSPLTIRQETTAVKSLAEHLKSEPKLTRAEAEHWLKVSGYYVSQRGFQSRVWPQARKQAGLPPLASPGRKPKSSR
jgi:hypothetical protein